MEKSTKKDTCKKLLQSIVVVALCFALQGCTSDERNFIIEDGILTAYTGMAKEITIPEDVTEIAESALSWDFDHGVKLEKVTVPGTVKKIHRGAFAFTTANVIYIEEGVEEIGEWAFGDSYIDEIHFPASLKTIGGGIMETEEGLDGAEIYVPKGSEIAKYFENDMPYGDAKLIYE